MSRSPLAYFLTFGTYGTRLHGGDRLTVDRQHNVPGTPYVRKNQRRARWERGILRFEPVMLTREQQVFIEVEAPHVCERAAWGYHVAGAGPDHVHVLVSADADGAVVRRLLKRWLGEALTARWPLAPGQSWWAEGGSVKPVVTRDYFNRVLDYIARQRSTDSPEPDRPRSGRPPGTGGPLRSPPPRPGRFRPG